MVRTSGELNIPCWVDYGQSWNVTLSMSSHSIHAAVMLDNITWSSSNSGGGAVAE